MSDLSPENLEPRPVAQKSPEKANPPFVPEKPKEIGRAERQIVDRIKQDGDEDQVLEDIATKGVDAVATKPEESLEARKARIDDVWSAWEEVQKVPELVTLFDRKAEATSDTDPRALLQEHGYPSRTRIPDLQFDTWTVSLKPKFVRDGYVYLLRGDYPSLEHKGFYTRPYGYGKKTTEQLTHDLQSSDEVGYALYGKDAYLKTSKPSTENIAQELAYRQSQIGGSSFVSTTTNLEPAIAGTGNQPDPEEKSKYEVYVVRIPVDSVINSNTNNYFGMNEDEYLVPDYITPDEIVEKFSRDQGEAIYQYMHEQLGVSREDLGMRIEVAESEPSNALGKPEKSPNS